MIVNSLTEIKIVRIEDIRAKVLNRKDAKPPFKTVYSCTT